MSFHPLKIYFCNFLRRKKSNFQVKFILPLCSLILSHLFAIIYIEIDVGLKKSNCRYILKHIHTFFFVLIIKFTHVHRKLLFTSRVGEKRDTKIVRGVKIFDSEGNYIISIGGGMWRSDWICVTVLRIVAVCKQGCILLSHWKENVRNISSSENVNRKNVQHLNVLKMFE